MKRKALVLGYDSRSFLSVIRSLGRPVSRFILRGTNLIAPRYGRGISLWLTTSLRFGWRTTSGRRE
jgi:hypothetical protein